jgi:hypothetical protein
MKSSFGSYRTYDFVKSRSFSLGETACGLLTVTDEAKTRSINQKP